MRHPGDCGEFTLGLCVAVLRGVFALRSGTAASEVALVLFAAAIVFGIADCFGQWNCCVNATGWPDSEVWRLAFSF